MVQQDVGFDAAFGTSELGPRKQRKQIETLVESKLTSLFLNRNLCWRVPNPCCSRNRASAVENKSSNRAAGRCSLA